MPSLKRIAISVGDLNGIGFEIILKAHDEIAKLCTPIYCIDHSMASQAATLMNRTLPDDFKISAVNQEFSITPGVVSGQSGEYSYKSFYNAVQLALSKEVEAIVTLPIHKEAWNRAGIKYKGHTDALRDLLDSEAIMMLGCDKLYVALFTEHIPYREVIEHINADEISDFLMRLYKSLNRSPIAVLGLNPHAGDNGVLGNEETEIHKAILMCNQKIGKEVFIGPMVPDVAFTKRNLKNYTIVAAMYHDQGLAPLKALYFDESINVSLGLPIVRTSVDHGTAFDIAYKDKALTLSYVNAIKSALDFTN